MKTIKLYFAALSFLTLTSCEKMDELNPTPLKNDFLEPSPTQPILTDSTDSLVDTIAVTVGQAVIDTSKFQKPVVDLNLPKDVIIEGKAEDLWNQSYGSNSLQTYDIHIPARRSLYNTKVMIIIHGGSWKELDKGFMQNYVNFIKSKGDNWVIVNMNYRLTFQGGVHYQQQLNDVSSVVNKVLSIRKQYNFSDKIYFMGASAGGHLALAYAYTRDNENKVRGVSVITPPVDLASDKIRSGGLASDIDKMVGQRFEQDPDAYKSKSPIYQVQSNSPATIAFFGNQDHLVPVEQGKRFQEVLNNKGVENEVYFYDDQGHEWMVLERSINKTLRFFGDKLNQ